MYELKKGTFILFVMLLGITLASALDLQFNSPGVKYFNITISNSSISDFKFSLTGNPLNSNYPSNISLDIANDGLIDWEYKSLDSSQPILLDSVISAYSNNPDNSQIDFVELSTGAISNMFYFGSLNNNVFIGNGNNKLNSLGVLGISTSSSNTLNEQIITIQTRNQTFHVFIPSLILDIASTALYTTLNGNSYFCALDHSSVFDPICDLDSTSAINPSHLAKSADKNSFDYREMVNNPLTQESINSVLDSCILPCNITVKVTSESEGILSIDDITYNSTSSYFPPSVISLSEDSTDYLISIQNYTELSSVRYFYGDIPTVYLFPFSAQDEDRFLSINQTNRLDKIRNNLSSQWDLLTNKTLPLNFEFYNFNDTYKIEGFNKGNSYSVVKDYLKDNPPVVFRDPAIVVMIDIWDYFPNLKNTNAIGELSSQGVIGSIYINGLNNLSITNFENYDDEILINIIMHELAHTFIGYPQVLLNGKPLFYTSHPAIFRTDSVIPDRYPDYLSPTSSEGYYDIYSIMNPIRPFLKSSVIGRGVEISPFDKMLMGLVSPDINKNYSFYSASIVYQTNKFTLSGLSKQFDISTDTLYQYNQKSSFYDLTSSDYTDLGVEESFKVSKSLQNNRSLWVFALDSVNKNHFNVFNLGATSSSKDIEMLLAKSDPALGMYISGANPLTYGTISNFIGVNTNIGDSDCIYSLSPSNKIFGAGTWTFNYSTTGCANYTSGSVTNDLVVNKANGEVNLLLNNLDANINFTYGNYINVSAKTNTTLIILRNGLDVTSENNFNILLPMGYYNYTIISLANQNYTSTIKTRFVNVTSQVSQTGNITIISDWNNFNSSQSTNLSNFTRSALGNIVNLTFVNSFGKMRFLENINLSRSINLTFLLGINQNKVWVNSSLLPELNKSAEITLYNINFADPVIDVDGVECLSSICSGIIFNSTSKELKFIVAKFSLYQVSERQVTVSNTPKSSGGSRGSSSSIKKNTTINSSTSNQSIGNSESLTNNEGSKEDIKGNDNSENKPNIFSSITGSAVNNNLNPSRKTLVLLTLTFVALIIALYLVHLNKGRNKSKADMQRIKDHLVNSFRVFF